MNSSTPIMIVLVVLALLAGFAVVMAAMEPNQQAPLRTDCCQRLGEQSEDMAQLRAAVIESMNLSAREDREGSRAVRKAALEHSHQWDCEWHNRTTAPTFTCNRVVSGE